MGDTVICPHLGNTKKGEGYKAMHVDPISKEMSDACKVNACSENH